MGKNNRQKEKYILYTFIGMLLAISLFALFIYRNKMKTSNLNEMVGAESYTYHYAMIHAGSADDFWDSLYQSARAEGEKNGAYVEDFGKSIQGNYSMEELVEMAIAANVNGIIIEGKQSQEMKNMIEKAESKQIPVILMNADVADSGRQSYVGANDYSLGELYGNQIVEVVAEKREAEGISKDKVLNATVLMDSSDTSSMTSLVYSSIRETVAKNDSQVEVTALVSKKSEDFESEEVIRNLLLSGEKRPDVIACLSSMDTISTYQSVIDYNLVGQVGIIGYYSAPEVLEGIRKGVIKSSIAVDAQEMGRLCVQHLDQYVLKRYVSEYASVAAKLITKDNVGDYMQQDTKK